MIKRYCWFMFLMIITALLVTSCSAPAPAAPTAAPSPTSQPIATQAPATATSAPTATAQPATPTSAPTTTSLPATATLAPSATRPPATATSAATVAATAAPTTSASSGGQSGKINLDTILPPGKGRELLLNNCTSCHSFVCAVTGQRTVDYWQTVKAGHRERVSSLSDDDFNALFTYLADNFNDKKPVPELPPELAGLGCSAQ